MAPKKEAKLKPVEITAETITDYLSKLCKNTVAIFNVLNTIHNDNIELKKSIDTLNEYIKNIKIPEKTIVKESTTELSETLPIIKPIPPPPRLIKESEDKPAPIIPSTQLLTEQSFPEPQISLKDQVKLELEKRKLKNDSKNLRCFNQHVVWLDQPDSNSDSILSKLKKD